MNITNDQRDQAYTIATKQQQHLYISQESEVFLLQMAETYHLNKDAHHQKLIILAGDVILGLRDRTDLPRILTEELGLTDEQSLLMNSDLIEFFDQPEKSSMASDIEEAEAALKSLEVHTPNIQTDTEPIYSSTQDSLLKEGQQTVKPTPKPTWGSDT
jgi:hypothetical protein